jgi:ABC-type multidrug transport system fused ATPase/permease subunit
MIREIPDPVTPEQIAGFIEIKQVTFVYPPRKKFGDEKEVLKDDKGGDIPKKRKKVLDEVSLSIDAGSRVAIVGPSGGGKSTLVSLIQRAYDPTSGFVEIDGINIRNLNLREFCRHIGIVDQGSLTINLSIRENVALGSQKPMTDEEIIECCRLAQLDVSSFDDGLDTVVGDMGSGISGGERQRIAIARAIASDPRILIFDEPTSSLDAMTEAKIKETIKQVSKGRTTIIIAHRLSTIQDCDEIFVMEKGKITASGTHSRLLDTSPTYRKFAEEQRIDF